MVHRVVCQCEIPRDWANNHLVHQRLWNKRHCKNSIVPDDNTQPPTTPPLGKFQVPPPDSPINHLRPHRLWQVTQYRCTTFTVAYGSRDTSMPHKVAAYSSWPLPVSGGTMPSAMQLPPTATPPSTPPEAPPLCFKCLRSILYITNFLRLVLGMLNLAFKHRCRQ